MKNKKPFFSDKSLEPKDQTQDYQVIFEFVQCGNSIKVSALDMATKIEVCITAPHSASQTYMEQMALKKLQYVLKKQRS